MPKTDLTVLSTLHSFILCSLKATEPGPLKAQPATVSLDHGIELIAGNMQLQAFAALKPEGDIVSGIRCSEAYPPPPEVAIFNSILPLSCHHSIYCQPGRMVIPVPLAEVPDENQCKREQE